MDTDVICESVVPCLVIHLHSTVLGMTQWEWKLTALHLTQILSVQSQMIRIRCTVLCWNGARSWHSLPVKMTKHFSIICNNVTPDADDACLINERWHDDLFCLQIQEGLMVVVALLFYQFWCAKMVLMSRCMEVVAMTRILAMTRVEEVRHNMEERGDAFLSDMALSLKYVQL